MYFVIVHFMVDLSLSQTPKKPEEKLSKSPLHSLSGSNLLSQLCLAIMRELGGGKTLLEFVCELPVLKAMEEDKGKGGLLALSTSGSPTDITEELSTVVKKLVNIQCHLCCMFLH